jgi:hypothetical protein
MATSSSSCTSQAYNSHNYKTRPPSTKKKAVSSTGEPLVFGRIPFSAIRTSTEIAPSSPISILKPTAMTAKRRASSVSLSHLLPRRKSLQTTVLASRRQSLWMNIAKNSTSTDAQPSLLPPRIEHTSLMRKKILRLLLVFSYLLSISLLAIALATFYGFFWSGYSIHQTTTVRSLIPFQSNLTSVDVDSVIEDVS